MRTIAVASIIIVLLVVMLVLSIATGTTGLAIIPFCGWTPAIGVLGYAIGRAGLKVNITTIHSPQPEQPRVKPIRRRESRLNNVG